MFWAWLNNIGLWTAIGVVFWSCLKTFQANPSSGFFRIWLQLIAYHSRYLVLWLLVWVSCYIAVGHYQAFYWVIGLFAVLFLYSTWIEPNQIQICRQIIPLGLTQAQQEPVKLIVISDIHVGIFSGKPKQLKKLVETINDIDADAVLIAGDWLYHAGADIIGQMLVLKALNKPCYTVFSEQDVEYDKQHTTSDNLSSALLTLGIHLLDGSRQTIRGLDVIGIGTNTNNHQWLNQQIQSKKPAIILTHDIQQIETNTHYLALMDSSKLIIVGQTHGGQVQIPHLTSLVVKASTGITSVSGLQLFNNYQVWTTTGVGMTGLPFRFNCPPRIDVLTIH